MSKEELQRFYEGKQKKPNLYDYDQEGNLIEKNKKGEIIKTIPLPIYRFPTFEEYDEMEKQRNEQIAKASKDFNDARKRLRELLEDPDVSKSEIFKQNNAIAQADIVLQKARFPLQYVNITGGAEGSIEIRQLNFDQPNEKRKYPYHIAMLETSPFTLQNKYVRVGVLPKKAMVSIQQAKEGAEKGEPVILFSEPDTNDYGFLSLSWAVDLEYNGTVYQSAKQAIYAEIAKAFHDDANLKMIMIAENPDAIVYELKNIPGDADVNEPKWNDLLNRYIYDINLIKFKKYPELGQRLLQTQKANLGAYLPNDNQLGIGISIDNIQSKDPINWTGQNLLGKALMSIREQIRSEQEALMQQVEAKPVKKPQFKIKINPKIGSVAAAPAPVEPDVIPPAAAELDVPIVPLKADVVESVPASIAMVSDVSIPSQRRVPRIASKSYSTQP